MKFLTYFLGGFRIIIGGTLVLLPNLALLAWLPGFQADDEIAVVLAQHMGIRDLVLGLGIVYCLRNQKSQWQMWLLGAMICDLTDVLLSVLRPDIFAPDGNPGSYIAGAILLSLQGWVLYQARGYQIKQ